MKFCDIDEPKGREFAQKYGCSKFYKDYNDMLKDPDIDIVCVCTPSGIHGECVIAAARAGRAILCEKPFEITRDKISRMIDEIDKARVKCACVFQLRTYAHKRMVRDAIKSGILGRLTLADAYLKDYRARSYYKSAGWRGTWELDGGGCLMNQGVHGVDQLLWLTGLEPESVFARADHLVRDIEVEDTCVANIQFTNGAFGTIVGATSCNPGEARRWEIHGDNGSICITGDTITHWATAPIGSDEMATDSMPAVEQGKAEANNDNTKIALEGHSFLLKDLIQSIKEDRDPYVVPREARKAVDLILSIYESARTHKEVKVPHF